MSTIITKIRLLLVDDHPVVLAGIKTSLLGSRTITVVGQASDAKSAVNRGKVLHPDIILLDLELPGMSGTDAFKLIQAELPSARIVIHTMHDDRELIKEFVRIGAKGYLLKGSSPAQISRAVEAVHRNKTFFSPLVSRILSEAPGAYAATERRTSVPRLIKKPEYGLTLKEKEILGYVVQGLRMREVATKLSLRYNTLTTHFKHIYAKLGVHTRGAVVAKTIREEIL